MNAETASWVAVQQLLKAGNAIAILPVGAQEQHGPHLPLATDTFMAVGLAERLAETLNALLLPAIPYGETWTTAGWPGTISLSFTTLAAIVTDIGAALAAQQVASLIVVNGHFGNAAPLQQASRILLEAHHLPTLILNYPGIEEAAAGICESTPAADGFFHADEVETSIMLHLQPHAVDMQLAVSEYPPFPVVFGSTPIRLHTLCTSGVFGDPRPSTPEKGVALLDALTRTALDVVKAFLKG